eukprot:236235-Amorphochlora_amoeboformis.AAC.2
MYMAIFQQSSRITIWTFSNDTPDVHHMDIFQRHLDVHMAIFQHDLDYDMAIFQHGLNYDMAIFQHGLEQRYGHFPAMI